MDDFSDAKKAILHCITIMMDDAVDLTNNPAKQKTDEIIRSCNEVIRQLEVMSEMRD